MTKNPHAQALGKLGGAAKSDKKTQAARANIRKRWYMSKMTAKEQAGQPTITTVKEQLKPWDKPKLPPGETELSTY